MLCISMRQLVVGCNLLPVRCAKIKSYRKTFLLIILCVPELNLALYICISLPLDLSVTTGNLYIIDLSVYPLIHIIYVFYVLSAKTYSKGISCVYLYR